MIRGLRTVSYPAPDLAKGKAWYGEVLEQEPYFDEPFYVGYNVDGFELGLVPDAKPGPDGPIGCWAVDDPFGNRFGIIENPLFKLTEVR